jgi:hypothetical protein
MYTASQRSPARVRRAPRAAIRRRYIRFEATPESSPRERIWGLRLRPEPMLQECVFSFVEVSILLHANYEAERILRPPPAIAKATPAALRPSELEKRRPPMARPADSGGP